MPSEPFTLIKYSWVMHFLQIADDGDKDQYLVGLEALPLS